MYLFIFILFTVGGSLELRASLVGMPSVRLSCEILYCDKIYIFTIGGRRE